MSEQLTVDILRDVFGEEITGRFIKNTIRYNRLDNPWAYRGRVGLMQPFPWYRSPEGSDFWQRVSAVLRRVGK